MIIHISVFRHVLFSIHIHYARSPFRDQPYLVITDTPWIGNTDTCKDMVRQAICRQKVPNLNFLIYQGFKMKDEEGGYSEGDKHIMLMLPKMVDEKESLFQMWSPRSRTERFSRRKRLNEIHNILNGPTIPLVQIWSRSFFTIRPQWWKCYQSKYQALMWVRNTIDFC